MVQLLNLQEDYSLKILDFKRFGAFLITLSIFVVCFMSNITINFNKTKGEGDTVEVSTVQANSSTILPAQLLPVLPPLPKHALPPLSKPSYDVPDASKLHVTFKHKPNVPCKDNGLLVLVTTSLNNYKQRSIIRKFWNKAKRTAKIHEVKVVFMLGTTQTKKTDHKISKEAEKYQDILQGSFIDSYLNLTVKIINGLRWFYEDCKFSRFVFFTDDDVSVNLFNVQKIMSENYNGFQNSIICGLATFYSNSVHRSGKWAVPRDRFSKEFFPPYCSGPCFMIPRDVVHKLYVTSRDVCTNVGLADVTVTGFLRQKANVAVRSSSGNLCVHLKTSPDIAERLAAAMEVNVK